MNLFSKYIGLKGSHYSICQSSSDPHISKEASQSAIKKGDNV